MVINGKECEFFYSVGAYLDIADLKLSAPKSMAENDRLYVMSAILMQKAAEDRKKLQNIEYEPNYLKLSEVRDLPFSSLNQLKAEVDEAYKRDGKITVETKPKRNQSTKKSEGTVVAK